MKSNPIFELGPKVLEFEKKKVPNPKLEGFKNWMNWAQTCNQREPPNNF
jgi:hypothetical protein